jgi:GT2 family glycosyltransferase/ubiquinone/menaquinone biosynthesis C-methylase UbiE/glycosyltransferase involved in cell wall biosynthesis
MEYTGERFIPLKDLMNDDTAFEHFHRYHHALGLVEDQVVLDIACGEGYGTALLAENAKKVYGVDIDNTCIEHAKQKYQNDNIEFLLGNVTRIPLKENSVDVVISYETIEHLDKKIQDAFLKEVKRILKKNGKLVISTPDKTNYSERYSQQNKFHLKEFSKEEFSSFLINYFKNVATLGQRYEIIDAITGENIDASTKPRICDWDRIGRPFEFKYLIAVCSDSEIETDLLSPSLVFKVNRDYWQVMDRIVEMEKHILELGAWGRRLDKEIEEKNIQIMEADDKSAVLKKLRTENNDKEKIISRQNEEAKNLHQQLNVLNARLSEIYNSEGWKLLKTYYRMKERLFPENSGRYKALKKIVNKIRGKNNSNLNPKVSKNDANKISSKKVYGVIVFPIFESPAVSIVMPAYNGWDLTYKCLASIKANTIGVSYEIIIGDDASTDETKNIKNYIKNITVIRNEKNLEFLHNCNHAAEYAKGKYILFLNNDTEVKPEWLSSMVELMERDETIGMVGSKLIYPNGLLQEAGAIIWNDASGWNFGYKKDPAAPEFNYVKEVDYISGASIIIRTELWKNIGGFDKRYSPAYCEDSDLAFEVRRHGYKVVYQPLSEVIHYEGYTHGTDQNEGIKGKEIKAYQKLNNEKFREKWKGVLAKEHFANGENVFWARDKSQNRKTILVIDHYVPHFDKDAGSKTVFQYLKLFVSLNMNVKFIGDNYFRHEPYTTILQQMGIEVLYGPDYANNWQQWISDNHDKFNYVLLNRPHISTKYIDFIKENTNAKIIYYGHDLHFVRLNRQHGIENKKELLEESEKWKNVEISLFNKADIILTPSQEERDLIKELGIRNKIYAIKPYIYDTIPDPVYDFSKRKDILFVGGFAHVPNIDAVLWFITEIWPLVKGKIAGARFIVAGSNPPPEVNAIANDNIDVMGFVSEETLKNLYGHIKLVVIPLRYGAGVKGKTVEAMFHGIPVVTTDSGIEGLPGDYSFLNPKNNAVDFANEVVRLYNASNEELISISNMEVQYIHDHFHSEVVRSEFLTILGHSKASNKITIDSNS